MLYHSGVDYNFYEMERDVSDTLEKDDVGVDATSIINDQKTHEQAKCDPFK